jgi:hypothetical protein
MFAQWMGVMKPLILTGWLVPEFTKPEFADLAVDFFFRFGWGELPSPDELATYLGPRTPDCQTRASLVGLCQPVESEQKQESQESQPG